MRLKRTDEFRADAVRIAVKDCTNQTSNVSLREMQREHYFHNLMTFIAQEQAAAVAVETPIES